MESEKRKRLVLPDILRGTAMIYVVLYHIMYDICFIYKRPAPALLTPGNEVFETAHTFFLMILFGVSGFCSSLSRNSLKRGAILYIAGYLITLATAYIMPSELIVFGVLSCFGACMVICSLIRPLTEKLPSSVFLALSVLCCIIFWDIPRSGGINLLFTSINLPIPDVGGEYLYPLGLRTQGFKSADYFPIFPYIFMFTAGQSTGALCKGKTAPQLLEKLRPGVVAFIGRHSLIIYALHQPVLILIFEMIFGGAF